MFLGYRPRIKLHPKVGKNRTDTNFPPIGPVFAYETQVRYTTGNVLKNVSKSTHVSSQLSLNHIAVSSSTDEAILPWLSSQIFPSFPTVAAFPRVFVIPLHVRSLNIFKARALLRTCLEFRG